MSETWKLVCCIRRKPDVDPDEFYRYWRENHARLVSSARDTLGLRRYVQSHTIAGEHTDLVRASRGAAEPFDGVAEIWMESAGIGEEQTDESMAAAMSLLEDETTFVDLPNSVFFWTREHEVFEA